MVTMGSKAIAVTEPENKCPECLHLEISGEIVTAKGFLPSFKKSEPDAIDLCVRINFNEQWVDFTFGRVKFGLRGGELRLKLENGKMPSELMNKKLKKSLETELTTERQLMVETENKPLVEASLGPDLTKAGLKVNLGNNQKKSQSDKFQLKNVQISNKGTADQPVWVFEDKSEEPVLIGELADSLGKMLIEDTPWSVDATFSSESRQVTITGLENLLGDDIRHNKRILIELLMAQVVLKSKTQPYLSRQVLRYE